MGNPTLRLSSVGINREVTIGHPIPGRGGPRIAALAFLLIVCSAMSPGTLAAAEDQMAVRPADTLSPRATLKSFIDSCNELYHRIKEEHRFDRTSSEYRPLAMRILDCLDLSELPEYEQLEAASDAAVCLKEILDRVDVPPYEEVPDTEEIETEGEEGKSSHWRIPGTRLTIARVEKGPHQHEYLFTPGTVQRAVEDYGDMRSLPYRTTGPEVSPDFYRWYISAPGHPMVAKVVDWLPDWAREQRLGQAIWKWIGLSVFVVIALLLMCMCYGFQNRYTRRFRDEKLFLYCLTIIFPIVASLIPLVFRHAVLNYLTLRGNCLYVMSFLSYLTALLASFVVVFGTSNRIAAVIIASPQINPQGLDAQFVRIVSKLSSIVIVAIIFLEGGNYLGIPVTTLIASAGIGGLAIALAAQDTMKNLFGTVMLLTDRPFRVDERIVFGKYDGVVEDIGLRSTRIRLLTGHQVTIPNDELARTDIENVGRRPHIRRVADIHIPLDTTRDRVEKAVAAIRTTLENHEGMTPEFPPRVFFFEFNASSFVIRVMYWYSPPNYWDFLAFSEEVNFEIFRAFDEHGIRFTLPLRTTYTNNESKQSPLEIKLLDNGQPPGIE